MAEAGAGSGVWRWANELELLHRTAGTRAGFGWGQGMARPVCWKQHAKSGMPGLLVSQARHTLLS